MKQQFVLAPENSIDLVVSRLEGFLADIFGRRYPLSRFDHFYTFSAKKPAVSERWMTDDEFARQRLQGINPTFIQRVHGALPPNFHLEPHQISGLLRPGQTLAEEIADGRVFIVDHTAIDGISVKPGRYLTAPMALFYRDAGDRLMPLAIQLGPKPVSVGGEALTFTPLDAPGLWQLVKAHFQCADMAWHEGVVHLLRTHLIIEAIHIAASRALPEQHPLYGLFQPHFRGTIPLNYLARTVLLAPNGWIDQTMSSAYEGTVEAVKRGYAIYDFALFDLRGDLERRGVADPGVLPSYPYRDDGLEVWDIIAKFAVEFLDVFYKSDADVQADTELQAFASEMTRPDAGGLPGAPTGFSTRAELQRFVTQVIFTASAQHAAVNNGQYDYIGYVSDYPAALYTPPPTDRVDRSDQEIADSFPPVAPAARQIGFVHVLSTPTRDPMTGEEKFLTADDPPFFEGNTAAQEAQSMMFARMKDLSEQIQGRNALRSLAYPYLDPRQIAQSIAI